MGCDDFCFLVKTDKLKFMKFNEKNFHLYAFDFSIRFQNWVKIMSYLLQNIIHHNFR